MLGTHTSVDKNICNLEQLLSGLRKIPKDVTAFQMRRLISQLHDTFPVDFTKINKSSVETVVGHEAELVLARKCTQADILSPPVKYCIACNDPLTQCQTLPRTGLYFNVEGPLLASAYTFQCRKHEQDNLYKGTSHEYN